MPPRRGGEDDRPSAEPFPPLQLSSSNTPSYATILRRPPPPSSSSSIGPASDTADHETPGTAVGPEDVDRTDALDDLNPFLGIGTSSRSSSTSLPWRTMLLTGRGAASAEPETGLQPEPEPSSASNQESRTTMRDRIPLLSLDQLLAETASSEASPTNTGPFDTGTGAAPSGPRIVFDYPGSSSDITLRARAVAQRIRDARRSNDGAEPSRAQPMERRPIPIPADSDDSHDDNDDSDSLWDWTGNAQQRLRLYRAARPTATGSDLSVVGGSGAVVSLRRGGNNRRRRSILDRIQDSEDDADNDNDESWIDIASSSRSAGLRPTNIDSTVEPLVVRSSSSRERGSTTTTSPTRIKRRKVSKHVPAENVQPPATAHPSYLSYTTLDPSVVLPTVFDPPSSDSRLFLTEHVTPEYARPCVTFTSAPLPPGREPDKFASALRTKLTIPVECGVHYYEVEVLDSGDNGYMSVGWMRRGVSLNRLVGWDKGSYGWHGDDGRSFEGQGVGEKFSETWSEGDTVGCGIDFVTGRAFFTKNGRLLGTCFKNLGSGLCPAVGLRNARESLVINFTGPFKYDIDRHVCGIRDKIWSSALHPSPAAPFVIPNIYPRKAVVSTLEALDSGSESESDKGGGEHVSAENGKDEVCGNIPPTSILRDEAERVNAAFVLDYLKQNGHESALSSLRNSMASRGWVNQGKQRESTDTSTGTTATYDEYSSMEDFPGIPACIAWLEKRLRQADVAVPIPLIHQLVPEPKDQAGPSILHYLFLLRRAERSRLGNGIEVAGTHGSDVEVEAEIDHDQFDMAALAFAREVDTQTSTWREQDQKAWKEAVALISLPTSSWSDGVAGQNYRDKVAEQCVKAIRQQHKIRVSYLEQAFAQAKYISPRLAKRDPSAAFIDISRILHDPPSILDQPASRERDQAE